MRMRPLSSLVTAVITSTVLVSPASYAQSFVVDHIEFNGLVRLSPQSVYTSLPITAGDTVDDANLAEAIRLLYATGNFADVAVSRHDNTLVFNVVERPVIADISFEGNKMIPKEALEKGLKSVGLQVGDVLKQSVLQSVESELEQQYVMQGYYNSDVVVEASELPSNRVKLNFKFVEGDPAKVVDIRIVGNTYFSDEDIEDVFAVKQSSWRTFLNKSDRYAREKLAASLENLTALYQNAGFIRFQVNNTVLNISEDKKKIFIEVSINEGEQYQFGEVHFLGKPLYETQELNDLVTIKSQSQYSQEEVTKTMLALKRHYGNAGYYNANIRPVPHINEETQRVDIDYFIDPSNPIYVRRINFNGNDKTADEVLRREMRQLEGTLASNEKIDLSKVRLQRTGYFKSVNVSTQPVPGQPDQIDVNFTVEEQPSGSTTLAAGYSQTGGMTFQVQLSQSNFLGTGDKVNLQLSRSETLDSYSIGFVDPYYTIDGVSRGVNAYYRKTKYDKKNISNYVTDSLGGSLNFGYPVDENKTVSAGLNIDQTTIRAGNGLAIANLQYMLENGITIDNSINASKPNTLTFNQLNDKNLSFESKYTTYNLNLGWNMTTLDRPVFPRKGMSHDIALDIALPGSDVEYQRIIYEGNLYQPIWGGFIGRGYTKLGYGNDLPFYKNFYAGGYGSVRGYENSSLGPQSARYVYANNDPYPEKIGGNALVQFGAELIVPLPFKGDWTSQVRPVLFVEGAQVFDTTDKDTKTFDNTNTPLLTKDEDFRYSAGAGFTWFTPIGPISLSYAVPFGDKKGDKLDKVQFEIGRFF